LWYDANLLPSMMNRAMLLVGCMLLATETCVQSEAKPYGICGGSTDIATGYSPSVVVFHHQYYSSTAYLFIYLLPVLYNLSN